MSTTIRAWFAALVLPALLPGCATAPKGLPSGSQATLDRLAAAPESAGTLVYDGTVRRLGAPIEGAPSFTYERRVRDEDGLQRSTHLTHDDRGGLPIAIVASHTADYAFVDVQQIHGQTGIVGHARMLDARRLELVRTRDGRTTHRVEHVDDPVVAGPTLFGWALAHWDELVAGKRLRVRFAAIDDARSYGFELRLLQRDDATTVLAFRATSPFVRAAVPAMRLVFDTKTRAILRYEGRVPPMLAGTRGLRPLDARVDYAHATARYR